MRIFNSLSIYRIKYTQALFSETARPFLTALNSQGRCSRRNLEDPQISTKKRDRHSKAVLTHDKRYQEKLIIHDLSRIP